MSISSDIAAVVSAIQSIVATDEGTLLNHLAQIEHSLSAVSTDSISAQIVKMETRFLAANARSAVVVRGFSSGLVNEISSHFASQASKLNSLS